MYKEYIILTILVSLYLYRRWKHRPLSDIPGPTSTSWVLGGSLNSIRLRVNNDSQVILRTYCVKMPQKRNFSGRNSLGA